jgi:ABC-type sugar transport system ATPase subunit
VTEFKQQEDSTRKPQTDRSVVPLVAKGLTKSYGHNLVLDSVTVTLSPGRVTALVGHNGAGKSTFLRCLSGAEQPDAGEILLGDQAQRFTNPADAMAAGLGCVYQELSLAENLTVAQNVFLGAEKTRGGFLSEREMRVATRELCAEFGIRARPDDRVSTLSVAQRQLIEVAAAIRRDVRYLLLDEPTTALEPHQIDHLLGTVKDLAAARGLAVLFVNHKLDEVFAVADEIVCLANGAIILDLEASATNRAEVIRAIVGDEGATGVDAHQRPQRARRTEAVGGAKAPVRLQVTGLSSPLLPGISLEVAAGEVLGIYGLVGSGRSRFLRTLLGDEPRTGGEVLLDGKAVSFPSVRHAMKEGFAYVSEERKVSGFIPNFDSLDNVILPVLKHFTKGGFIDRRGARSAGLRELQKVSVRGSLTRPIVELSGGNQQKVLFARASMQAPKVLLLDEPTKGVDIGAKAELHRIVRKLAAEQNAAVIVVSSEEEELLGLADSICVFTAGGCDGTTYAPADIGPGDLRRLAWGDADEKEGATMAMTERR